MKIVLGLIALGMMQVTNAAATDVRCGQPDAMSLQLLGSGGPISDDARASSGEVIWVNGKSKILIDAGGGTYLRFGQAGARLEDLDFIGISHFHTDHSADLPALLKGAYFIQNEHQVTLAGPAGAGVFPSMNGFFSAMFDPQSGPYAYLAGLRDGSDGFSLRVSPIVDIDNRKATPSLVYEDAEVKITALGIPHGRVPAVAYRIESAYGSIVISADQNGQDPKFAQFAKDADILVMPAAIDDDANQVSRFLHAPPTAVGEISAAANPRMLVLNHFMGRALKDQDTNVEVVKNHYKGPIHAGRDLSCYVIPAKPQDH